MVNYNTTQVLYCIAHLHIYTIPNTSDYKYAFITLGDSIIYIIVGAIIGVIIVVTLLLIMFCCLWKKKGYVCPLYVNVCYVHCLYHTNGILWETKCNWSCSLHSYRYTYN